MLRLCYVASSVPICTMAEWIVVRASLGRGRGLLVSCLALALTLGACSSSGQQTGSGPSASGTHLTVFGAGTLAHPFAAVFAAFKAAHPGVTIDSKFEGSVALTTEIAGVGAPADVLGVADYSLIPKSLFGAGGKKRFASWYVGFVANAITFAYTDKSKGAAQLTPKNWYQVLAQPGVRIGRSSPDTDPSGYQTLQMLQLANGYYQDPKLSSAVLANSPNETAATTETSLLAALQAGQIDYLAIYESDAKQNGLKYLSLPPQINLSQAGMAKTYGTVSVATASGPRVGKPIVYGLTVLDNAADKALAEQFAAFVIGPQGQDIMRSNGFVPLLPALSAGALPASLAAFATPWPSH